MNHDTPRWLYRYCHLLLFTVHFHVGISPDTIVFPHHPLDGLKN